MVNCSGTDTTGVLAPAANGVLVTVFNGANITTTGHAINLGSIATIAVANGGTVSSSGGDSIRIRSGEIDIEEGGSVLGNTIFTTSAGEVFLKGSMGTVTFSNSLGVFHLYDNGSFTSVSAGSSTVDEFILSGLTGNTFDTNRIGVTVTGFNEFIKEDDGTWTLTGSTVQNWNVTGGTLVGTTTNLGNIDLALTGSLKFDQNTGGTYSNVISGFTVGEVIIDGDIEFTGNNTYFANTRILTGSSLKIDNESRLGAAVNNLILEDLGTLAVTNNNFTMVRDITLEGTGGTFRLDNSAVTLSGTISGAGGLVFDLLNGGTADLTGNNTYMGGTTINSGTLSVSSDSNLGDVTGDIGISNGALLLNGSINTTRNLIVDGGTIDTNGNSFETSGAFSGSGKLYITGGGTVTLTGMGSHTGGINLSGTTLVGNTSTLSGGLENNGLTEFSQNTNGTYADLIKDTVGIVKTGTGTVTFTANNTYTGGTQVYGGKLVINGNQQGSDVYIAGNGTLGGGGHIGDLSLDGTLEPGNSIGTLTVHGNMDFNNGSTYNVEINNAGNSDLLAVIGATTINTGSSVFVDAATGSYTNGTLYTILTSTGAITGTFDNLTTNLAFLTPNLIYNANNIQLQLTGNGSSFNIVAKNNVQKRIADIVEGLGSGNALYDAFSGLTIVDAQSALDDLSNANTSGLGGAIEIMNTGMRAALTNRLQTLAYQFDSSGSGMGTLVMGGNSIQASDVAKAPIAPSAGDADPRYQYGNGQSRIWSEVFGTDGKSNPRGSAARQDRGSYGMLVGMDKMIDKGTYFGIFGGYETGEVNTYSQSASTELNNYHLGVYATHMMDSGFKLNGGLGGTYHDIHTQRYITFGGLSEAPEGNTNGFTTIGFIEGSRPVKINDIAFEPFVGINLTYSYIDGYTEENGGVTNLTVHESTTITPTHTIGVRAGQPIQLDNDDVIQLGGMLGWQHAYGNLNDKTTMSFGGSSGNFNSYGPGRTRDTILVGLGFTADLSKNFDLYGHYNGQLAKESQDHVFSAGVRYQF